MPRPLRFSALLNWVKTPNQRVETDAGAVGGVKRITSDAWQSVDRSAGHEKNGNPKEKEGCKRCFPSTCAEDLSAEAMVGRLIGVVKAFAGDVPQGDDMTVVVLKVEA